MQQRQGGGGWFDGNNKQYNSDGLFDGQFNNNNHEQNQNFGGNNGWNQNQSPQGNFNSNMNTNNNNFWPTRNNDGGGGGGGGNNNNTNDFSGNNSNIGGNNFIGSGRNFNNSGRGGRVGGNGVGSGGGNGSGGGSGGNNGRGGGSGGGSSGGNGREGVSIFRGNSYRGNTRNFNYQNSGSDNSNNQSTNRNINSNQTFRGNRGNVISGRGGGGGGSSSRGSGINSNMGKPTFKNDNIGNVAGGSGDNQQVKKVNETQTVKNLKNEQQIVAYPNITGIKLQKMQTNDAADQCKERTSSLPVIPTNVSLPIATIQKSEKSNDAEQIINNPLSKPQRLPNNIKPISQIVSDYIQGQPEKTTATTLTTQKRTSNEMTDKKSEEKSFKIPKLTQSKNQENTDSIPIAPPPPIISPSKSNQSNQIISSASVESTGNTIYKKIIYEFSNNILNDPYNLGYRIITETDELTDTTKTLNVQSIPFMLLKKDEQQIIVKRYLPFIDNNPNTNNRIFKMSTLSADGICIIDIVDPINQIIKNSMKRKFYEFSLGDQFAIIQNYIEKDKLINENLYTVANVEPVEFEKDIITVPLPVFNKNKLRVTILKYSDERGYENIKRDTKLAKILQERLINAAKLSTNNTKIPTFTYVGVLDNLFRANCLNSETRIWLEDNLIHWIDDLYEIDEEKCTGNVVTNFSLILREQIFNMKKINFVITADNPKSWPIMSKRIKIQNPQMSPDEWITEKIEPFMEIGVKYYFYVPNNGIKCNASIGGVIPGSGGDPIFKLYFGLDSLIINRE